MPIGGLFIPHTLLWFVKKKEKLFVEVNGQDDNLCGGLQQLLMLSCMSK
jgi:hypothetical protein